MIFLIQDGNVLVVEEIGCHGHILGGKELSEKLGLTFDQTIEILINRREINSFFDWVNACEYLEEKIWEEPDGH